MSLLAFGFGATIAVFPIKAAVSSTIPYTEPQGNVMEANEQVTNDLYQKWLLSKKTGPLCSCVLFAKALTGFTQSVGAARNWPKNINGPVVGGVVITKESYAGHVAVITAIYDDSFEVIEGNYESCKKSKRMIKMDDPNILGYWIGGE